MDYSDSIEIAVAPEVAFAAIADLTAMGRRSPENTGGEWLAPARGPARGAKFKGTNAHGSQTWTTTAVVSVYEPPRRFAFEVKFGIVRISRWAFEVEATKLGCRVVETWSDQRNVIVRRRGDKDGFRRSEFTKVSIRTTLENLQRELEAPTPPA